MALVYSFFLLYVVGSVLSDCNEQFLLVMITKLFIRWMNVV